MKRHLSCFEEDQQPLKKKHKTNNPVVSHVNVSNTIIEKRKYEINCILKNTARMLTDRGYVIGFQSNIDEFDKIASNDDDDDDEEEQEQEQEQFQDDEEEIMDKFENDDLDEDNEDLDKEEEQDQEQEQDIMEDEEDDEDEDEQRQNNGIEGIEDEFEDDDDLDSLDLKKENTDDDEEEDQEPNEDESKEIYETLLDRNIIFTGLDNKQKTFAVIMFFDKTINMGISLLREVIIMIEKRGYQRVLFITHKKWTSPSRDTLQLQKNFECEIFTTADLSICVVDHILQPKFRMLSPQETKEFLSRRKLTRKDLPRLNPDDPVRRYYNFPMKSVIEVKFYSITNGIGKRYRVVMHPTRC